ncbi:MAG: AAA family ATPase [Magnetospirillum sp.]|nr:AAA family ATPase [Magnetospirillum sp.]
MAYEAWRATGDRTLLDQIEAYNAIDCSSTSSARDWLLSIRPREVTWFAPAAPSLDGESQQARAEGEEDLAIIETALVVRATDRDLPFRRLIADLLNFHRREQKPEWWALFDRRGRAEADHIDDPECLGGLRLVGEPTPDRRSLIHRFACPPQETKLREGDRPINVETWEPVGEIAALDMDRGVVTLRRSATKGPLPDQLSIGPGKPVDDKVLRGALRRFAIHVALGTGRFLALEQLLRREPPRLVGREPGTPIVTDGEDRLAGAIAAAAALDHSYLYLQGPPGTGKTYTAARVVIHLLRRGARVGLASHSHKAINNLCAAIEEAAREIGFSFRGCKKSTDQDSMFGGRMIRDVTSADQVAGMSVVAGTAWLFARPEFEQAFDYLVVDEAGQVSLANLVAMGMAARNVIVVGDQMQLSQPIQGCHPGKSGLGALEFLLEGMPTVPPDRGILLDTSWRMHPHLCRWVSEAFYDGRLRAHPSLVSQSLLLRADAHPALARHGLRFVPVEHQGRSQRSPEEAGVVRDIWYSLVGQRWRDRHGIGRPIGPQGVLVVAPYNMQVNAIRDLLPAEARVGTVDRFQGQEAPVVILSMTTSSGDDLPRDIAFLFSRQRLNVAISRARCLAIILASPRLLEVPCRTVEEMRMVNTLCHANEWAPRTQCARDLLGFTRNVT